MTVISSRGPIVSPFTSGHPLESVEITYHGVTSGREHDPEGGFVGGNDGMLLGAFEGEEVGRDEGMVDDS